MRSLRKNAFLEGAAIWVRSLYELTNFIRPLEDEAIVSSPALMSGPWTGTPAGDSAPFPSVSSIYLASASLRDAIGVTVFMISCVSTRMRRVHDSASFSSMSLLMSLNATIFTFFPLISAEDAVIDRVMREDSL